MSGDATSRRPLRILLRAEADDLAAQCLPLLEQLGSVRVARSEDEALAALRAEAFDLVVAGGSELLPLAHAAARDLRHAMLDCIAQGVCVVDREGKLLWSNATLKAYPPQVGETAHEVCAGLVDELAADPSQPARRQPISVAEHHFDLTVSAVPDAKGGIDRIVGLVCDTTAISRMRERFDAIDSAGRELVALDADASSRLELSERLALLEDRLIQCCRELLHFSHFAVLVLDPATDRLETVLMGGFPEQVKGLTLFARKEGSGISGYVAATGQAYICPDVSQDPLYLVGIEGARSSLTVPLRLIDRVVGVLNVEADRPDAFTEEDRQVAEIFARYIAVALHTLKLLAAERSETTGEVTADVRTELATPLNDIVAEAAHLLEVGMEAADAPRRLQTIIDQVDRAKEALQDAAATPAIRGLIPETPVSDLVLQGKRVLIADDEDIIRETIGDVLSKAGALTVMARDGEQAISMINTQRFDLVLSDIKMPYKNGYEVYAAVRQVHPDCQVILITGFGYDPEHSIVRASREGLAGVLFKPFKVEQLFEMIHKALGAAPG